MHLCRFWYQRRAWRDPPHKIELHKGAVHIVATWDYINFLFTDQRVKDLIDYLPQVGVPDEALFSTVNHNAIFNAPGGFPCKPIKFEVLHNLYRLTSCAVLLDGSELRNFAISSRFLVGIANVLPLLGDRQRNACCKISFHLKMVFKHAISWFPSSQMVGNGFPGRFMEYCATFAWLYSDDINPVVSTRWGRL